MSYIVHEDTQVTCIQHLLILLVMSVIIISPCVYIFKISDFLSQHYGAISRQVWLHSMNCSLSASCACEHPRLCTSRSFSQQVGLTQISLLLTLSVLFFHIFS